MASHDGFTLHGTYYDPGRPGPGVLMIHQCNRRGADTGFESIAPALATRGFHVLTYDSRGFGRSRSDAFPDYRSQSDAIDKVVRRDVAAAYEFLRTQDGVQSDTMGVLGASCGVWQVIPFATEHPEVRALVFLSGSYLDLPEVTEAFGEIANRPVLCIFSEDDRYRTPESMRDAFARSTHPASEMMVLKGDTHGAPLFREHRSLEADVTRWLEDRLIAQP